MPTRIVSAIVSGSPPQSHDAVVRFGKPLPPCGVRCRGRPRNCRRTACGRSARTISIKRGSAWIAAKLSASMRSVQAARSSAACSELSLDGGALVDAEQALGVGQPERPGRHQHPVDDGEQRRHDQEEIDRPAEPACSVP